MKQTSAGALSGCLVWIIAFGVISMCILPISMMIGGFTSVTDFAMETIAPLICPEGTSAQSRSYQTTTTDENGNRQPSTAYVMQCVDSNGNVVKEDPVGYAFLWTGMFAAIGLVLSGILAFVLAAPAGVLIAKILGRIKKNP
ncbi:MAG TPA: hypothetical protein PKK96_12920 [Anaerolineales bacterium]|nr:hypothetical protein [Anaerolineales bacterium]HMS00405.1 hypothetical protein [Anaerolineales bacterium]HNQ95499.1 hypothetical protein [Anaerolineales bacterium]HNS61902.1 hypothetical protein [Anaerolineales bacterium]